MSRSNRGEKNHFSMLKWRTINYKMKAPPGSTRTPAKLYWKADGKARRRGEKKRDWEKDRFIREYIVYVLCVAYPPWVLDWIGSIAASAIQTLEASMWVGLSPVPVSNWNYTFPSDPPFPDTPSRLPLFPFAVRFFFSVLYRPNSPKFWCLVVRNHWGKRK